MGIQIPDYGEDLDIGNMPTQTALAKLMIAYIALGKIFLAETQGDSDPAILLQREFTERMIIANSNLINEFETRGKDVTLRKLFGLV